MDSDRLEIVNIINKCFGDFGWSFSISNVYLDYVDDNRSGNYTAGASAVVRVQQNDGIFREALGYGWSFGSIKAEVISKAKKDAVNDGLRGAAVNFGGNIAKCMSQYQATMKKTVNGIPSEASPQNRINAVPPTVSQTATKTPSVVRNIADVQTLAFAPGNNVSSLAPIVTSPVMAPKPVSAPVMVPKPVSAPVPTRASPVAHKSPPRVTPIPRISPPLALPLLQNSAPVPNQLSEEELAKIERKRRQRQRQEEFRQKHLVEKAQVQTKALEKKPEVPQSRTPLKEQQLPQPSNSRPTDSGNNPNTLDVDDDVLLSTQDMEAAVQIAANNPNDSRRSAMISSPSHSRPPSEVKRQPSKLSTAHKRPDLTNYAFNAEKKARGMQ